MALDQAESNPLLSKMLQHFFRISYDQMKSGCRVVVMEANENPGYKISRQSCAGCESHNSSYYTRLIQLPQNLFKLSKDILQPFSEMGSSWGQRHALGRADEQGCFQVGLQPADLAGNGRLGEMKPASRFRDLARFSNDQEGL
jgi:hypothetical protein